jgi:predicted secreted protein
MAAGDKIRGEVLALYVNIGTDGSPDYDLLGSEESLTINETAGTIDTSDKSSAGNPSKIAGAQEWDISANGQHVENDPALAALRASKKNRALIKIKIKTADGLMQTGSVLVTSLSTTAAKNDVVRLTMALTGATELVSATAA